MQVNDSPIIPVGRVDAVHANIVGGVALAVFVGGYLLLLSAMGEAVSPEVFDFRLTFVFVVVGVVMHELAHGIGFRFGGVPWSKIRFGILWKYLMPYVACSEEMPVESYRLAVILPGVTTGLLPWLAGGVLHLQELAVAGAFLTAAAAGDALVWARTRAVPPGTMVRDLSETVGFGVVLDGNGTPVPPPPGAPN